MYAPPGSNAARATGKTLVAVACINHYLGTQEAATPKPVLFVVPTRALVTQQADYCRRHCVLKSTAEVRIGEVKGEDASRWDKGTWHMFLGSNDVLLGTPEVSVACGHQLAVPARRITKGHTSRMAEVSKVAG